MHPRVSLSSRWLGAGLLAGLLLASPVAHAAWAEEEEAQALTAVDSLRPAADAKIGAFASPSAGFEDPVISRGGDLITYAAQLEGLGLALERHQSAGKKALAARAALGDRMRSDLGDLAALADRNAKALDAARLPGADTMREQGKQLRNMARAWSKPASVDLGSAHEQLDGLRRTTSGVAKKANVGRFDAKVFVLTTHREIARIDALLASGRNGTLCTEQLGKYVTGRRTSLESSFGGASAALAPDSMTVPNPGQGLIAENGFVGESGKGLIAENGLHVALPTNVGAGFGFVSLHIGQAGVQLKTATARKELQVARIGLESLVAKL